MKIKFIKIAIIFLILSSKAFASNLMNAGFELPNTAVRLELSGVTNSWDYAPSAFRCGVIPQNEGSFCPTLAAAEGNQFGYLWCGGDEIAQTINGLVTGVVYNISWAEAARTASGAGGKLWVLMDDETISASHDIPADETWVHTNVYFKATATSHRLRFFHSGAWDKMIFIDKVEVGAPETFPKFTVPGFDIEMENFQNMFYLHYKENIEQTPTYNSGWLPMSFSWVGLEPITGNEKRNFYNSLLTSRKISTNGYVTCNQPYGLAHADGWPCSDNDVTVNSVLFSGTGKTSSIFIANGNPTLVGTNWAAIDSDGAFEQDYPWTVDDVSPPSGVANTGKQLLEDVLFDKYGDYYLELDVTPGTSNVFTFYRHAWADDETFQTVANDGGAPKEFTYGAAGTGGIIEYKYLAPENGKFKIVVSPAKTISAFSNYEITNSIIPILESINELNFGEIVPGESKTLLLPIFNLGGETVSGVFSNFSAPFSFPDGSNYFAMPESPDFVNITFAPFTDGNFSNTITLSGCGGSAQVELKGTAIPEPFLFINCYLLFIIYYLRKRM